MRSRLLPLLVALLLVGCDAALSPSQQLVGRWVGRPETAVERTAREWPGGGEWGGRGREASGESPDADEVLPTTDLEAFADVRVRLDLRPLGEAELSLDGGRPLRGAWSLTPGEGRRMLLEIEVSTEGDAAADEPTPASAGGDGAAERRRFEIQWTAGDGASGPRFVLREAAADPRFGRLIFERASE